MVELLDGGSRRARVIYLLQSHGMHIYTYTIGVIALTFFALFSLPSPSFFSYDFTTLSLFLYPTTIHSFLYPYLPLSHESRTRRNGPRPSFNDLLLVHAYWYCYCWRLSPTWTTLSTLLTKTREPRHLRTPTTGLAMGQDLRKKEGDPPPRPTEEPTS